jgi:hypothetical protein
MLSIGITRMLQVHWCLSCQIPLGIGFRVFALSENARLRLAPFETNSTPPVPGVEIALSSYGEGSLVGQVS